MPNEEVVAESTPQEVVKESVETTEQVATPVENVQQPQESATVEAVKDDEVDEKGVPYKNRYMEAQRKLQTIQQEYQGLQSNLPDLIQNAVAKAIPQKEATPTYSKEELIKFKNSETTSPEHRTWAEIELEKLRSKDAEEFFRNQTQAKEKQMKFDQERQAAYQYVAGNYGVMMNPDGSWNNAHPLTQKLARIINSDETLRNHPSGLRVAADMAVAEHIRETQPNMMKQTNQLKRTIKKLQTATLIEGSGQPQTVKKVDTLGNAMERLSKYGDKNSSKAVAAELIKRVHAGLV
jgi:hypothetical protein